VAGRNEEDRGGAERCPPPRARVVTYGVHADADWRAIDVTHDELARATFTVHRPGSSSKPARVVLPLPGAHNVSNALAAIAVADEAGVDLASAAAALAQATVSRWRMQLLRTPDGLIILNDAYNANPSSTEAALRTLSRVATAGRRWAVLGGMAELGTTSADEHVTVGRLCAEVGVDGLVAVGADAAAIAEGARTAGLADVTTVDDPEAALAALRDRLAPGDAVLVKASRSVGLEVLADRIAVGSGDEGSG
jgi:UDP-N-acetylmuramoyl-tripeptide--D-alanyl-D-alanine ligase